VVRARIGFRHAFAGRLASPLSNRPVRSAAARLGAATAARAVAWHLLLCLAAAWFWPAVADGQQARNELLIDADPYDVMILKEEMGSFHVMPLAITPRKPIESIPPTATYEVRLIDRPDKRYRIRGEAIAKIRLFEELVLEEAAGRIERGDFASAYRAYRYLQQKSPGFAGLDAAWQTALMKEAEHWIEQKEWDRAWRVLLALHERNPKFDRLSAGLGRVAEAIVRGALARDRVRRARAVMVQLGKLSPGHSALGGLNKLLREYAAKQLAASADAAKAADGGAALVALRRAAMADPDNQEVRTRHRQAELESPVYTLAVRESIDAASRQVPWSWSLRRRRWLTAPPLVVLPVKPDTMPLQSPLGSWTVEGKAARFRPEPSGRWDRSAVLRRLRLRFAVAPWRSLFPLKVEADGERDLRVVSSGHGAASWLGLLDEPIPESSRYVEKIDDGRRIYEPAAAGWPRLVERSIVPTEELLQAFQALEVVVVDRVMPWEVSRLANVPSVRIEPSGTTTMYWIVFNPRSEVVADPLRRWALVRGVDRRRVLEDLCEGTAEGIAWPLDSFLPQAWSGKREAIAYEPETLAAVWGRSARRGNDTPQRLRLTLVHSDDAVSRRAAAAIQRQWELDGLGPSVKLRRTDQFPPQENWDAALLAWSGFDPRWDTWRLLGPGGATGTPAPVVRRALRQLAADNAKAFSRGLAAVADAVAAESTLVPLWEIQEYYGRVPELQGVGTRPDPIHQSVTAWRYVIPSEPAKPSP